MKVQVEKIVGVINKWANLHGAFGHATSGVAERHCIMGGFEKELNGVVTPGNTISDKPILSHQITKEYGLSYPRQRELQGLNDKFPIEGTDARRIALINKVKEWNTKGNGEVKQS